MIVNENIYNKMPTYLQKLFNKLPNYGSEEVLAGFPVSESGGLKGRRSEEIYNHDNKICGKGIANNRRPFGFDDTGSAARFFYCAKASKAERGAYNDHPTVKPQALLRYLCKLTKTPTSGIIIDPFMGSGSILRAALDEGRQAIGIDQDEHACELAVRRLEEYLTDGYSEELRTSKVAINKKLF